MTRPWGHEKHIDAYRHAEFEMISCHFPVGRYPQLYDEPDLSEEEEARIKHRHDRAMLLRRSQRERHATEKAREQAEAIRQRDVQRAKDARKQAEQSSARPPVEPRNNGSPRMIVILYPDSMCEESRTLGTVIASPNALPFRDNKVRYISRPTSGPTLEVRVRP